MAKKKPQLKVVFDTNALFTKIAHQLFQTEVTEVIQRHSNHTDLSIIWYIPDTVIEERRYQMISRSQALLPHLHKVESLLGHQLGISLDVLYDRVDAAIAKHIDNVGITRLRLDTDTVNWPNLIRRAVRREPPFDPGDKEKGFRDAVVAETFLQLVDAAPITPSTCRLILITGDQLMTEYVQSKTTDRKNVYVLPDISELEGLINTLVSAVTEEFVAAMKDKCERFFFIKDDEESLFYEKGLKQKIMETYTETLQETPSVATRRENGMLWISPPVFVKKEKQRVFWYTAVTVDARAYRTESVYSDPATISILPKILDSITPSRKVEVAKGQSRFNIHWSISISQTKKLSSVRLGEIDNLGTTWESEDSD